MAAFRLIAPPGTQALPGYVVLPLGLPNCITCQPPPGAPAWGQPPPLVLPPPGSSGLKGAQHLRHADVAGEV
jgi:hypothetical protein